MNEHGMVVGREGQRAAKLATLIAAFHQKERDEDPGNGLRSPGLDCPAIYGSLRGELFDPHIPLHRRRGNRRCRACSPLYQTDANPQVVFRCSMIDLLKGLSPVDWEMYPRKDFQEVGSEALAVETVDRSLRSADVPSVSFPRDPHQVQCHTCAMLIEGICDVFDSGKILDVLYASYRSLEVSVNFEEGLLVSYAGLRLEYYLLRGAPPSPWNFIKPATHVPTDSQSDEAYNNIRRWVSECIDIHQICPSNELVYLPKRLVDLSDMQNLKLYESTGESGRYTALSHRWGISLIKTTLASYSSRKQRIMWKELPKVFQDAISITRRLGLKYIWIDSLCIVQDDIRDWQEQSAQMASIYAGSFVTISATSAENSDSACLSLKNKSDDPIPLNSHQIFAREQIKHEHIFDSRENDAAHPVFSRAWCFQERLLATRTLHYTHEEIIFECRTGYQCECGGIWKGNDVAVSGCLKLAYGQILQESRVIGNGDRYLGPTLSSSCNKETLLWFRVLGDYTKKKMTFERDTLPALSGVADRMPSDLMGIYLAGLWKKDLLYGLLWRSADELNCQRYRTYIAPSFSWASRSGPITFPSFTSRFQPSASILDAECEVATLNRTGEVRDGFVKLRGSLVELSYTTDLGDGTSPPISVLKKKSLDQKAAVMVDTRQDAAEIAPYSVFCLSMLQYGRPPKHVALVLKQCNFPGRGLGFMRIGLANEVPGPWFRNVAEREVMIY